MRRAYHREYSEENSLEAEAHPLPLGALMTGGESWYGHEVNSFGPTTKLLCRCKCLCNCSRMQYIPEYSKILRVCESLQPADAEFYPYVRRHRVRSQSIMCCTSGIHKPPLDLLVLFLFRRQQQNDLY